MSKHRYVVNAQFKDLNDPNWIFGATIEDNNILDLCMKLVKELRLAEIEHDEYVERKRKENEQHQ